MLERNLSLNFRESVLEREKLFSSITKFASYQDAIKLIPKNSLYITVQLNKTKTKMMVAVMESETDPANRKFKARVKGISDK